MPRILMNPRTKKFEIENREVNVNDELKIFVNELGRAFYGIVKLDENENFVFSFPLESGEMVNFDLRKFEFADLITPRIVKKKKELER